MFFHYFCPISCGLTKVFDWLSHNIILNKLPVTMGGFKYCFNTYNPSCLSILAHRVSLPISPETWVNHSSITQSTSTITGMTYNGPKRDLNLGSVTLFYLNLQWLINPLSQHGRNPLCQRGRNPRSQHGRIMLFYCTFHLLNFDLHNHLFRRH